VTDLQPPASGVRSVKRAMATLDFLAAAAPAAVRVTDVANADLWCCATALEPGPDGEVLALTVVAMGEPAARERARICRAMRRESQNVGFLLSPAG
jgi:hypothetical protein